jgi:hypothetical protein
MQIHHPVDSQEAHKGAFRDQTLIPLWQGERAPSPRTVRRDRSFHEHVPAEDAPTDLVDDSVNELEAFKVIGDRVSRSDDTKRSIDWFAEVRFEQHPDRDRTFIWFYRSG